MWRCLAGLLLLLFAQFGQTTPQLVSGQWKQGALIKAKVSPGTHVEFLGRAVHVDELGYFVIGLGRDTAARVSLITRVGDESHTHAFSVEQRQYDIQEVDGVASKYVAPPESVLERIRREAAEVALARSQYSSVRFFDRGFDWPLKGRITGVYGSQRVFNGVPKRPHYGLDIAGPVGARVVAPAPGIVRLVHDDMYYSGGTLVIDHGQGVSSTFIHLSQIFVVPDQHVAAGEIIAAVGNTGRTTGPHLDWRVNWFDQRLDPQLLLPAAE